MVKRYCVVLLMATALIISVLCGGGVAYAAVTEGGERINTAFAENLFGYSAENGASFTFEDVTDYNGVVGDTGVLVTITPNRSGVVPAYFYSEIPMFTSDGIDVTYKILADSPVFNPTGSRTSYADSVGVGFLPEISQTFSDNVNAKGLIFSSQWGLSCRVPADGTLAGKNPPGNSDGFAVDCGAYGFADALAGNDYRVTVSTNADKDEFVLGFNKFFDETVYEAWNAMHLYPAPYAEGANQLQLRPSNLDKVYFTFYVLMNTNEGTAPASFRILIKDLAAYEYAIDYQLNEGVNGDNPDSYIPGTAVVLNDASKTGYDFEGWYTTAAFEENTKITEIPASQKGKLTLYAKFTVKKYEVKFYQENGTTQIGSTQTIEYGKDAVAEIAPEKIGHTFSHWIRTDNGEIVDDFTNITADISVKAVYSANTYTITYFLNGGTNAETNPAEFTYGTEVVLGSAVKGGSRFDGWYTTETFEEGTMVTKISATQEGNVTLYAKFTEISASYTVTIQHSEDGMSVTVLIVPEGVAVDVSVLSAEGYKLVGLYTDAAYTQAYTAEMKITADTTLYAKWESLSTENTDGATNPEKESGCGASVAEASAAVGMLAMGAAAVALCKKKERK